ncbi:MAG: hypothetical protein A2144_02240 [Chloroflexi bacterium RBG_16_50_9]|nr:MAG: hypothetical protein A2144_02240 [Chloroflexi bacterium RBG_16_50_9]
MARGAVDRRPATASARVKKLREKVLVTPEICIERGQLVTESYRETEREPAIIRRARSLEKVLSKMTIDIDDELIVGRATTKVRGAPLLPEVSWKWYLEEMDTFSARDIDRFAPLTEAEKIKMKEFLPYWEGKSVYEKWRAMLPENMEKLYLKIGAPTSSPVGAMYLTHNAVDYEKVLARGLNGIKLEVDEQLGKLDPTDLTYLEKYLFLRAVNITLGAVTGFAKRYARLAGRLAEKEKNVQRKIELERIAEICDHVPADPARSFHEALQSVWFMFIAVMIEGWSTALSFGRADQYLYPYYKKDIQEGIITREKALELIELLYVKVQGLVTIFGSATVRNAAGFLRQFSITLGGVTRDGRDAVNELSYLFLEADAQVRLSAPDLVIRVNRNTPDAFLMRAIEVLRILNGKYKFVSDETIIQQMLENGKPVEYARDYIVAGCWASTVGGRSLDLPGPHLNLALMLELALNNGMSRLTGEQIGPKTGDPRKFKSYNEVWDAYKKQTEAQIRTLIFLRNVDRQSFVDFAPTPLQSALFDGCIEKGKDVANGGTAPHITHGLIASAAPNVGDSLAAIKKVVFEDKKITMGRLIDALDRDFRGEEEVLRILESVPRFGNDNDDVDSIVNDVLVHFSREVARFRSVAGAKSTSAAAIVTANVPMGQLVGALPDGRRAGEPLSEGGISPYQGRNVSGPVATMRSVAKLDHMKLTNGSVLNMRFNPDALKDESKMRKFASLIRTYCETGGYLVQFNIVDTRILKEAQKHPENYRDLLIRVATYSAYFVELSQELQDDIIARMEFQDV